MQRELLVDKQETGLNEKLCFVCVMSAWQFE